MDGMWFFILLAVVVAGFAAYKFRVPLIAKLTGQSPDRIRRHLK